MKVAATPECSRPLQVDPVANPSVWLSLPVCPCRYHPAGGRESVFANAKHLLIRTARVDHGIPILCQILSFLQDYRDLQPNASICS
jgi:hypothetical protein